MQSGLGSGLVKDHRGQGSGGPGDGEVATGAQSAEVACHSWQVTFTVFFISGNKAPKGLTL